MPWVLSELVAGATVVIYLKTESARVFSGTAVLIRPEPSWRTPEPYPIVLKCKSCRRQVNAIDQRWLVQYPDGFVTHRWLTTLIKPGTIKIDDDNISNKEPEELLGDVWDDSGGTDLF